jgi:hypothetical protein
MGFFTPSCPVGEVERLWIETSLAWFADDQRTVGLRRD